MFDKITYNKKWRKNHREYHSKKSLQIYKKNKEYYAEQRGKKRISRTEKIQQIKLKKGCFDCGYKKYAGALEFHHLNPKTKSFCVGQNVCRRWEKIELEMQKCIVLCANCHRERKGEK